MGDGEVTEPAPPPLAAAADRIRETAKWLIVAFAAVGSALIAGSQLSDLGALTAGSTRFWIAIAGTVLALAAIVVAILLVSSVLVVAPVALSLLAEDTGPLEKIRTTIEKDETLVPDGSVKCLKQKYVTAQATQLEAYARWRDNPDDDDLLRNAKRADGALRVQEVLARNVLDVAQFLAVSGAYKGVKWWLVASAAVAAVGGMAFAGAANPVSGTGRVAVSTPGTAVVELSDRGQGLLRPQLDCPRRRLPAIVLAVSSSGVELVTQPVGRCRPVRVTIGRGLGSVIGG